MAERPIRRLTTLRQALRVGRMMRTRGRVKPWSLKGVSSSGGVSKDASLTLFATIVSRVLYVRLYYYRGVLVDLVYCAKEVKFPYLPSILVILHGV